MKKLNNFYHDLKNAFSHIVMFGLAFAIIGYLVPHTYYEFFDRSTYFTLELPIKIAKKVITPCESNTILMTRFASQDISAVISIQMVLEKYEGDEMIKSETYKTPISKGQKTVVISWKMDCDIELGTYYYHGVVSYMPHSQEFFTPFYTEKFEVVASPSGNLNN